MRCANSEPMVRTLANPKRTSGRSSSPSIVTSALETLTSGRRTVTPWRCASATRLWGDQNPMGCALRSAAKNAAG